MNTRDNRTYITIGGDLVTSPVRPLDRLPVGTVIAGVAAIPVVTVLGLMFGARAGIVLSSLALAVLAALGVEWDGRRSGYETARLIAQWRLTRRRGEHIYRDSAVSGAAQR